MTTLLEERIFTDYAQYYIIWDREYFMDGLGDVATFYGGQRNGFLGTSTESGIFVSCYRNSGDISVRIEVADGAPELSDLWDDVLEASTHVGDGCILATWGLECEYPLELGGLYRVRLSMRELEFEEDRPFEEHLLQFWRVESKAGDDIVRERSELGKWMNRNGLQFRSQP